MMAQAMFGSFYFLYRWWCWWFCWICPLIRFHILSLPWENEDTLFCPLAFVVCSWWEIPMADQREGGERSKYLLFWHIYFQGWLGLAVSPFGRFMDFSRQFPLWAFPIRALITELSHPSGQRRVKSISVTSHCTILVVSLDPAHWF